MNVALTRFKKNIQEVESYMRAVNTVEDTLENNCESSSSNKTDSEKSEKNEEVKDEN
jgi:hypothetical protein